MDPKRWEKIQSIFERVVIAEKTDQGKLLDQLCGDDQELRNEVFSLLESDEKDFSILEKPVTDLVDFESGKIKPGMVIGRYKIIKQIGYGGMGEVYLAERVDNQFNQQVALKVVKRGMDSNDTIRRFHDERQILARLNHPNIARLYDGGLTSDNRPFFTMEYIEGEPITKYCDRHELSISKRLHLFNDVLEAVQHAHKNFIVHRDLKPGNIIVTQEGRVKLLDFGIAKLVDTSNLTDVDQQLTQTGYRVMTPGYASPEQIKGEDITTASDVYSLGVILYELLSGFPPFEIKGKSPGEIENLICQTDPKRPSTAVTKLKSVNSRDEDISIISDQRKTYPDKLRKMLKGDLDNICLKALEKEPIRRYSSVEQLYNDINRYLSGHPVKARPATYSYRAGKFIKRHKTAVFASTVAFVLIVFLVSFYTVQLSNERDKAQLEAQKAKQVSAYITSIFELANPSVAKGETITARELVKEGEKSLEEELADQPLVQAEMMIVISDVYYSMGDLVEARDISQKALDVMLEHDQSNLVGIAEVYHDLADLNYDLGEFKVADSQYQKAYDLKKSVLSENDTLIAVELIGLGTLARLENNFERSRQMYEEALRIQLASLEKPHLDMAYTMNNLGRLFQNNQMIDKAEPLLKEALAMRRELLGDDNFEVVASMGSLASMYYQSDQADKSKELYEQALAILIKLVGDDHHYTGGITQSLANAESKLKNYERAEELYLRSYNILKTQLPEDHVNIAYPISGLGRMLVLIERYDDGIKYLDEALRIRKLSLPDDNQNIAMVETYLGRAYYYKNEFNKSETYLKHAYQIFSDKFGNDNFQTQEVIGYLVDLFKLLGNDEQQKTYQNLKISQK